MQYEGAMMAYYMGGIPSNICTQSNNAFRIEK